MREYVVKVRCRGSRGTGFVVGRGLVATALHVVAERTPEGMVPRDGACSLEFTRLDPASGTWEQRETTGEIVPGAWDLDDDWVLLRFDPEAVEGWAAGVAGLARLAEPAVSGRRLAWSSWGFPDVHPLLGMETAGHIRTVSASLAAMTPGRGPVTAIQLFSEEAAAGLGMPVRGLSGAPVVVEGNVVGLLRYSLLQSAANGEERRNQAGTLYATPIERLRDPGGLFRWQDADRLPPLAPGERLPAEPFHFLARYEREDCRIFFGRGSDIRRLLSDLQRNDLPTVGLLFGPMGAGKSSFLRAGIAARLAPRALHVEARGTAGLRAIWRQLEQKVGSSEDLPVLDQLEETWTAGNGDDELAALLVEVAGWLQTRGSRGGLQLFLSFREERLPSVEDGLRRHGMRWHPFPLGHLDAQGLLETMVGFETEPALRDFYRLEFAPGSLPRRIVDAVLTGSGGTVAPVLQVLLSRLWARAKDRAAADGARRTIREKDFEEEQAAAAGLQDFLDRQLEEVERRYPQSVTSGLALEVLAQHTTPGGTARSRPVDELVERYPIDAIVPIPDLLDALGAAKLLYPDGVVSQRLAHDALAPVVQHALAKSDRRAQRARRALESRVVDWRGGPEGPTLDDAGLREVEAGLRHMARLEAGSDEMRLLTASRQARRRRLWVKAGVAALLALTSIGLALALRGWLNQQRGRTEALAENMLRSSREVALTEAEDPVKGLALAVAAAGLAPRESERRGSYVGHAYAAAFLAPTRSVLLPVLARGGALSADSRFALTYTDASEVQLWDLERRRPLPTPRLSLGERPITASFDPDGSRAAVELTAGSGRDSKSQILVWKIRDPGSANRVSETALIAYQRRLELTPSGMVVQTGRTSLLQRWALTSYDIADDRPVLELTSSVNGRLDGRGRIPLNRIDGGAVALWPRRLADPDVAASLHRGELQAMDVETGQRASGMLPVDVGPIDRLFDAQWIPNQPMAVVARTVRGNQVEWSIARFRSGTLSSGWSTSRCGRDFGGPKILSVDSKGLVVARCGRSLHVQCFSATAPQPFGQQCRDASSDPVPPIEERVSSGVPFYRIPNDQLWVTANGHDVVLLKGAHMLEVVDLYSGQDVWPARKVGENVVAAQLTPGRQQLVTLDRDGGVRWWPVDRGDRQCSYTSGVVEGRRWKIARGSTVLEDHRGCVTHWLRRGSRQVQTLPAGGCRVFSGGSGDQAPAESPLVDVVLPGASRISEVRRRADGGTSIAYVAGSDTPKVAGREGYAYFEAGQRLVLKRKAPMSYRHCDATGLGHLVLSGDGEHAVYSFAEEMKLLELSTCETHTFKGTRAEWGNWLPIISRAAVRVTDDSIELRFSKRTWRLRPRVLGDDRLELVDESGRPVALSLAVDPASLKKISTVSEDGRLVALDIGRIRPSNVTDAVRRLNIFFDMFGRLDHSIRVIDTFSGLPVLATTPTRRGWLAITFEAGGEELMALDDSGGILRCAIGPAEGATPAWLRPLSELLTGGVVDVNTSSFEPTVLSRQREDEVRADSCRHLAGDLSEWAEILYRRLQTTGACPR